MKNIFTKRHCDKMEKLKTGTYITNKKKKKNQFNSFGFISLSLSTPSVLLLASAWDMSEHGNFSCSV